jgi:hypothetical protein
MGKPDWIKIKRGDRMPWLAGLHVTLNRKGWIVFNRTTYERIGNPEAVHLLYDRTNNRIGLQPTRTVMKDAYPVRKANRYGAMMVSAFRLLTEHAIRVPDTLEFPDVEIDEDGILIIDLRTGHVSKRYLSRLKRERSVGECGQ